MKSMYEPIEWLEQARLDFYEETKGMRPSEFTAHIRAKSQQIREELGISWEKADLQPIAPHARV